MFTGIIEALGTVKSIHQEGTNFNIKVASPLSSELKIDQSLSHNGVCLTVVETGNGWHVVTAVEETLNRTSFRDLASGDAINLERAMVAGARLDGHMVQGHVDGVATCTSVKDENGSWSFTFSFNPEEGHLLVNKGSICINGVSLTVVEPDAHSFSVAIIPYTFENTNFKHLKAGDMVNIEFDILGKYITGYLSRYADHFKLN